MLHRDIVIVHGLGLGLGGIEGGVHVGGNVEPIRLPAGLHRGELPKLRLRRRVQTLHGDIHFLKKLRDQPTLLAQQGQEQMDLL